VIDETRLRDALAEALRHAFVPDMQGGDGNPFQFVDLMSDPGGTIASGERRIKDFAESLAELVLEALDEPPSTGPSAGTSRPERICTDCGLRVGGDTGKAEDF
jgi:hypothetical protein